MSYTDNAGKIILKKYEAVNVPIYATVVTGDLLAYDSGNYGFKLADQSDGIPALLVACQPGVSGDTIEAATAVIITVQPTNTAGVFSETYLALAADIGAPLYLGESGKAQSSAGATCAQGVGMMTSRTTALLVPMSYLTGVNISASGTLAVTGNATLGGTLAVTGVSTLTGATTVTGKLTANGSVDVGSAGVVAGVGTGANGIKLKNLKNAAAGTLTGTALNVEIDIGGTPYYFAVYPTKS
jgi:hypothetical protein